MEHKPGPAIPCLPIDLFLPVYCGLEWAQIPEQPEPNRAEGEDGKQCGVDRKVGADGQLWLWSRCFSWTLTCSREMPAIIPTLHQPVRPQVLPKLCGVGGRPGEGEGSLEWSTWGQPTAFQGW